MEWFEIITLICAIIAACPMIIDFIKWGKSIIKFIKKRLHKQQLRRKDLLQLINRLENLDVSNLRQLEWLCESIIKEVKSKNKNYIQNLLNDFKQEYNGYSLTEKQENIIKEIRKINKMKKPQD